MNYVYQEGSNQESGVQRSALERLLRELEAGDCLAVSRLSGAADSPEALLALLDDLNRRDIRFRSMEEGLDTGTEQGRFAVEFLRAVLQLEQPEAAKENAAKGRKPIEVDEELFDRILERWKNGEMTARQAMAELNLKPNTFYRRVKERTESKNADSLLNAAQKLGKEIANTVAEGAEGLQRSAEKIAADCDISGLSDTVKKNFTAAGMVLSSRVDSLSKDFQQAMERMKKQPDSAQAPAEGEPVPEQPENQEPNQPGCDESEIPVEDL